MKRFAGLVLCGLLGGAGAAVADGMVASAVVDWNQITVDAVTVGRPGPIGMVDIALVQVAVHDAVQAIEKRFEPYHFDRPGTAKSTTRSGDRSRRSWMQATTEIRKRWRTPPGNR